VNINQAFPSKYLKASDLEGNTVIVKIADVKVEAVGRDQDTKPVVYFEGKKKGLVLNKTNSNKIAQIAQSHETDEWVGVTIAIYPTEVEFSGESVEAIRVKAPKSAAAVGPKVVTDEEAIGF
jgi:hypothetical protein